jgi:hypothetical protein
MQHFTFDVLDEAYGEQASADRRVGVRAHRLGGL